MAASTGVKTAVGYRGYARSGLQHGLRALAAAIKGPRPGTGLCCRRHRQRRGRPGGGSGCGMAGGRLPRRDGLYGPPRRSAQPPDPGAGNDQRHLCRPSTADRAPRANPCRFGRQTYVPCYALGRDYHKTVRQRLQKLGYRHRRNRRGPFGYRVFSDSAPVLEVEFARQAGPGLAETRPAALPAGFPGVFSATCSPDLPPPRIAAPPTTAHLHHCLPPAPPPPSRRPYRWTPGAASLSHHRRLAIPKTCAPHRQPHLRLRRLPARLPWNPLRPIGRP